MFLFHEHKLTETHQEMFKECIKSFTSKSIAVVTDKEKSIVKAIKQETPSLQILYC